MPRGLTAAEERLRDALIESGETGAGNAVLDALNRKLTSTMTQEELEDAAERHPGGQAQQELDRRAEEQAKEEDRIDLDIDDDEEGK